VVLIVLCAFALASFLQFTIPSWRR
jgi:hypothetical protein